MQIVENRALQFVTDKANQIKSLIPRSAVLEDNGTEAEMLVAWGEDEWRLLRNLGVPDVPHPIVGRYKWPGVYTPFKHQIETAAFLAANPRCYVLNEAGTGKTSAAAWAADYLMKKGRVQRALIVCPLSIMDTAWRSDLFKTVMHRSVGIATGDRKQREAVVRSGAQFVIINFDGIKTIPQALKDGGFDLIIIDEATAIKSVSTDRWKALASIVGPNTMVWAMTGTPAAQSPEDAYGIAKLVRPASVPRFAGAWRDKVMNKITQYKWAPKPNAKEIVYETLQPAIRFTKAECLDLPELLYTTRDVELTAQQKKYYDTIKRQMMVVAAGEEITAANAASLLNKLLQVSAGAVYTDTQEVVQFDISNRINELVDIIEGTDHKVLVFVPFRHVLEMLLDELKKRALRFIGNNPDSYDVEVIHGGVSAGARSDIIKRFQTEDRTKVLLMIPQATAHGITLTRADQVVWWGPVSSTEIYLQANARAHRAGQSVNVTVTHLQGSPVERRMYKMLQDKVDLHLSLVDLYKQEIA
jgi:SNF2 family DNA or RNA helicase